MGQIIKSWVMGAALMLTVSAVSLWAGVHQNDRDTVLDEQAYTNVNHAVVVYQKAPEFSIKVSANPTTGYSWFLAQHDGSIEPMHHRYYPSQSGKVGAPGYEVWVFRVTAPAFVVPQVLKVDMLYARPFEMAHGHHKVFSVVTGIQPRHTDSH